MKRDRLNFQGLRKVRLVLILDLTLTTEEILETEDKDPSEEILEIEEDKDPSE